MELEKIEALVHNGVELKRLMYDIINVFRLKEEHKDGFSNTDVRSGIKTNIQYYAICDKGLFLADELMGLDKQLISEYITKYMNKHKDEIMIEVADMMIEDARRNKENAIEELENRKRELLDILKD